MKRTSIVLFVTIGLAMVLPQPAAAQGHHGGLGRLQC